MVMGNLGNGLEIRHVVARVANGLDIDGLGLVVNGGGEVGGLVSLHELRLDAEPGQEDLELVVRATVQVAGGDDVVACVSEG